MRVRHPAIRARALILSLSLACCVLIAPLCILPLRQMRAVRSIRSVGGEVEYSAGATIVIRMRNDHIQLQRPKPSPLDESTGVFGGMRNVATADVLVDTWDSPVSVQFRDANLPPEEILQL